MKKLLLTLVLFASIFFMSSCASDTVVVYRDYPGTVYYYPYTYWNWYHYTYHYPRPHHHTYKPHPFHHYMPNTPPKPHGNNHHSYIPPKPTNVPKATVRPHNNGTSGSMSGRQRGNTNNGRR